MLAIFLLYSACLSLLVGLPLYGFYRKSFLQSLFYLQEPLVKETITGIVKAIGGFGLTIGLLLRIILEHKKKLRALTLKDDLSELANRRSLNSYVDQLISKERPFQLALIRVRGIRQLNENYGHQAGDEALINVCEKLQLHLIKESDGYTEQGFLARLSGNYLVYINSVTNKNVDIEAVLSDLLNQINTKGISLQIGVACYPHHGSHFVEVLTAAEMVLSEYKSVKTNLVQKIDSNKLLECRSQQAMAYALIKAINTEEIEVYYQPKYTLNSSATSNEPTLIAAEALARWTYQGENVPPIIFIQLAEDYDLIGELDALVMKKSWLKACALSKSGHSLKIAVNYSSSSMEKKDKLIQLVESLMSNYQLEPTLLEIEITESAMAQSGNTHEQLQALRNLGISIAIDDFGTGYSNLSQLQALPLDTIKIDKAFVDLIETNPMITEFIIEMAHKLKLSIVAEGVEKQEQLIWLTERGCHQVQGYLLSKPLAENEFMKIVSG